MKAIGDWNIADVDEIVTLHGEMLAKYGGISGAANRKCVDGSIGAAINAAMYQVDEGEDADLLCFVAHMLVYLARNHCFTDGNKRAAWASVVRVLDLNGMRIRGDDPEAASLVERASTGDADVGEVIRWLGDADRLLASPNVLDSPASPQTTALQQPTASSAPPPVADLS